MLFTPKTQPFPHQAQDFERSKDLEAFAVFWEMGCGKSKLIIDTAAYLYGKGEIDGLLVLAPNGVHRNWVSDEIPTHLPEEIREESLVYYSAKAKTKSQIEGVEWLMKHRGLATLVMSYDGFVTDRGKAVAKEFLTKRRCMMVLDECELIKSPGAQRTKLVLGAARYAKYRRIMTGTPVANSPFDVYAPMRFLDLDFWKKRNLGNFVVFKNEFAVFQHITPRGGGRGWDQLLKYRNLDQLNAILKDHSSRLLKEDVLKDLPPKLFSKRYFDLSAEQARVYAELKHEFLTTLAGGEEITAVLALVRGTRFAQITSNFLPSGEGDDKVLVPISDKNPRLDLLMETLDSVPHQAIVWARFTENINQITHALGERCVRYDGPVSDRDRALNIDKFKAGDAQFFVANPQAIGRGVTLVNAKTVVYYNNDFRLVNRLQSEDRAHRIGQHDAVQYIDLVAQGTIDEHIVKALRDKFDIAAQVTGDRLREWI